jgi:hypothetical protein
MKAWRERETEMMRLANVEFKKLTAEEQRIMVAAVRDDEKGLAGKE